MGSSLESIIEFYLFRDPVHRSKLSCVTVDASAIFAGVRVGEYNKQRMFTS